MDRSFVRPMTSPFWKEDVARDDRIRALESKGNLSLEEQIQLHNDKVTRQIKRAEAYQDSQARIQEKEAKLKEMELDRQLAPPPAAARLSVEELQEQWEERDKKRRRSALEKARLELEEREVFGKLKSQQ